MSRKINEGTNVDTIGWFFFFIIMVAKIVLGIPVKTMK